MLSTLKVKKKSVFLMSTFLSFTALGEVKSLSCKDLPTNTKALEFTQNEFENYLSAQKKENQINQILGKPESKSIDKILVAKDRKELYLVKDSKILKTYKIALGDTPKGHKHFEGDGKTPEGIYFIDFKNSNSNYHLSLHISYPNKNDIEYARSVGISAGGAVMIHGFPNDSKKSVEVGETHPQDWTNGCIAVTNAEIEEIFLLTKENTMIEICPLN